MRLPTASALGRAIKCPASCVLPSADAESEHAARGTSRHAYAAAVHEGASKTTALALLPAEHRDEAGGMDLASVRAFLGDGDVLIEAAYSYDPVSGTGAYLGSNIKRAYPADAGFCGTADYVAIHGDHARILDLKGTKKGDEWQLRLQALAVAAVHGVEWVTAAFGYVRGDGSIDTSEQYEWSALHLADFRDELRELIGALTRAEMKHKGGETLSVYSGAHCEYCRAFVYCPAKTALVRTLTDAPKELTPVVAADAWEKLVAAEELLKRVRGALEEYAKREPFQLTDGRIVKETESSREYIDGKVALKVLTEEYGEDITNAIIEPSCTKTALNAKLKNGEAKRALQLIKDAGGVKVTTSKSVKAVSK